MLVGGPNTGMALMTQESFEFTDFSRSFYDCSAFFLPSLSIHLRVSIHYSVDTTYYMCLEASKAVVMPSPSSKALL